MKKLCNLLLVFLTILLFLNSCASKPKLNPYNPKGKDNTVYVDKEKEKYNPVLQKKTVQRSIKEDIQSKFSKKLLKKAGKKDKEYLIPIYNALQKKEYNNALSQIESLDYTYPNDEDLHYLEGIAYLEKNDLTKALSSFSKCISINKDRGDALFYKSLVLNKLKRLGAALNTINNAINLKNTPSQLVYQESLRHQSSDWTKDGREASLFFMRATIYKSLREYNTALDDINKAISINKEENSNYYSLKGEIYFLKKEYRVAHKNLKKSVTIYSDNGWAWHLMGIIDLYSEKYHQAITHFKKADKFDLESSISITNLGLAYWLAGERDMALESMGAAIGKEPNGQMYFHLAYFHHVMNNKSQARIFFKKAQQLEPDIVEVRTKLSKLPPQDSGLYAFFKKEINAAKKYLK